MARDNNTASAVSDVWNTPRTAASINPWSDAVEALGQGIRRNIVAIIFVSLLAAGLAGLAKYTLPAEYNATAQVLIDPRGVNVDANDLFGQFDANAAINFVESQMVILRSDRVLLSAIKENNLAQPKDSNVSVSPAKAQADALKALQSALSVERGDRSFIVNVTVQDHDPELAANIANSIVKAFTDIDTQDRASLSTRLQSQFDSRLEGLQQAVKQASLNIEAFQHENGLIGVDGVSGLEQQLKQTIDALGTAESRQDQAQARLSQLEAAPKDLAAIGPLGNDVTSRSLTEKIQALSKARSDEAALSGIMLRKHPALISARRKVQALNDEVMSRLAELRQSVEAEVDRYRGEAKALRTRAADLSEKLSKARSAEVGLQALETELDGKKKIFDKFASRYREVREFGDIDNSNIRVVSPARAPIEVKPLRGIAMWSVAGAMIGLLLALTALCFSDPVWSAATRSRHAGS